MELTIVCSLLALVALGFAWLRARRTWSEQLSANQLFPGLSLSALGALAIGIFPLLSVILLASLAMFFGVAWAVKDARGSISR